MDGGNGLSYQCEWNNATDDVVEFGEGVNDEMCFLWAYYYPSVGVGFDVCMNIDVTNPTRNICNNLLR
jgi:hypothetical protein